MHGQFFQMYLDIYDAILWITAYDGRFVSIVKHNLFLSCKDVISRFWHIKTRDGSLNKARSQYLVWKNTNYISFSIKWTIKNLFFIYIVNGQLGGIAILLWLWKLSIKLKKVWYNKGKCNLWEQEVLWNKLILTTKTLVLGQCASMFCWDRSL